MTMAILPECRISPSQEEVLATLGGGWERSVQYVLDETPSQQFLEPDVASAVPVPDDDGSGSGSETSESEVGEGFTQEPVEWASPPSSPAAFEDARENMRTGGEDSYNAAFESDRSQSPTQDWNGGLRQRGHTVRISIDMGVQIIKEPPSGGMFSQPLAQFGDNEHGEGENRNLVAETSSPPKSQGPPEGHPRSAPTLSPNPTNRINVDLTRNFVEDYSAQPITQPPFGTQIPDSPPEMQAFLGGKRNWYLEQVRHMQQESRRDEITPDTLLPDIDSGPSRFPKTAQDVAESSKAAELHFEQERLPQAEQTRTAYGDKECHPSTSKRVNNFEELSGQEKKQRIGCQPMRARSFPKTVMDVVRSRSSPMSESVVDDGCNILNIIMRAGVTFPPCVHRKHSF